MAQTSPRRVPKQQRSQERFDIVLDTAANLFLEKGFNDTTTNEIARRAGISIGSLYQYFDNKEAIVEALTDRYVEALKAVTADVLGTELNDVPTAPAIDRLLTPILEFHANHPAFRPLWLGTEVSTNLRNSMRGMDAEVVGRVEELLETRAPGIPRDRARIVVTVMVLAVKSLLSLLGRSESPRFKTQAAAEMKRMLVAYVEDVVREESARDPDNSPS